MAELMVPQVDFRGLGDLGDVYQANMLRAQRQRTLADLAQGNGPIDYDNAARRLLAIGDSQSALTLANLGRAIEERQYQHGRDEVADQFRRDEAQRAQANADRSYALQVRTATEKPAYQVVEDASGNKRLLRIDPYKDPSQAVTDVTPGAVTGGTATNPFAYGKQNENQSKDSGYANRMFSAEQVLRDPEVERAATSATQNVLGHAPGFTANYLTGKNFQRFDQARRDFVNAVLRRESGAAISASEFANAEAQYFPQPGDTPEKIAQKRINRQNAIAGVAGGGGPSYRPPYTFDEKGGMVPTGNGGQGVRPTAPAQNLDVQGSIANARAAIAAGKSRDGVIAVLRKNGIDPALLDQVPQVPPVASPISDRLDLSQGIPTMEQGGSSLPPFVLDLAGRLARTRDGRQNSGPVASIGIRG